MRQLFTWTVCCLMATACTCQDRQKPDTEQPADSIASYQGGDELSNQTFHDQAALEEHIKQMQELKEQGGSMASGMANSQQNIPAGENQGPYQTYEEAQPQSSLDTAEGQTNLAKIREQKSKFIGSKRTLPDPAAIYAQHCARCHGADGRGNGPDEASLGVVPTNFHEAELKFGSSIEHLVYSTKYGQSEDEMPAFEKTLKDEEIWSVAFYIQEWLPN